MINAQITLQGFECRVFDGEANKTVDGKITEEKVPIKILQFKDAHSATEIRVVFSPEELEKFAEQLAQASGRIVQAPADAFRNFTRNGGIRG